MVTYTDMGFGIALAALLICLTDIIFTLMDGHTGKPQNRFYISILAILAVNALTEMVNVATQERLLTSDCAYLLSRIAKYVYFLSHTLLAPMFYYYISYVVGKRVGTGLRHGTSTGTRSPLRIFLLAVVIVSEAILAVNPLTGWSWYYDADRTFHRAWGEYVIVYFLSAVWIVGSFILVMQSWNILSRNSKRSITVCFMLVEMGIVIQLLSSTMRVEVLMEALGFTGVLLFIENEDDRRNAELGVYNAAAFALDVSAAFRNRIPAHILILRSIRFDRTANTVVSGRTNRDAVSLAVAEYLSTVVRWYHIYSIGHNRFAVVLYHQTNEEVRELSEQIMQRFGRTWHIDASDIYLASRILLVHIPDRAASLEDVRYIAECPIPEQMQERIIADDSLDWIIRRAAVENAVAKGLGNGSFEVYYQPTYTIDRRLHGAEALIRMHDAKMGTIYPDEFIPIAEQLGLIDELDEFVLREVCRFLLTGIPQKYGMDCINVNLSVLECMKDGFAEHISGIVEHAGVHKKLINFEITESVVSRNYKHLSDVIDRLKQEGFLFSIDDYGTGYSNMTTLFSLGADIIKIDKSLLWNAEKSALGMTLLKTSVEMVHEMGKKALMEGVETEAHIRILKELGCDYLQGYYFSKPIPQDAFIELISQETAS